MAEPSRAMRIRMAAWGVTATGPVRRTPSSELLPGTRRGTAVMLKIASVDEEVRGSALLEWWHGRGAVDVLERDDLATLMVRATGRRELTVMAKSGQDAAATGVLVQTALELHKHRPPGAGDNVPLLPLRIWFRALLESTTSDPVVRSAARVAATLLTATGPGDEVALHGDIHHGNVLDFGDRWAAIDPKGLIGHRAFDFANILCNPSLGSATDNLTDRLDLISRQAALDRTLLAGWTIAWCGLSLTWSQNERSPSWHARAARQVAQALLAQ